MQGLSHHQVVVMFLALGLLLGVARILGELANRFRQPAVLGELLAGVLLGPTVLGNLSPDLKDFFFPAQGPNAIALSAITTLAVVLFLLVAGLEVDLSIVRRQGRVAPRVSVAGIVIPFIIGFAVAWLAPEAMGRHDGADPLIFALFFATALSISALPVIAKTLMDLDLYRSDLGMVIVSAAIVDDLIGWIIFAVILGMMGGEASHGGSVAFTVVMTLTFAGLMLTLGRSLVHKVFPYVQAYTRWPGGVLGFALVLALFGAALAESIGIHAIFGSFLAGVAIGDSSHLRERTRVTIEHFVSFIFAPVFFASIGLKVNFVAHFNLPLVVTVLAIACLCKLLGGSLGALWGGMSKREAWAVGFAMNSRGAMEIILGILALEAGIIGQELFVALVIMAIVTSMMSGPMMRLILRSSRRRRLHEVLSSKLFIPELKATTRREVVAEMTAFACEAAGLETGPVEAAVWAREEALSTGIGNGVALPHARIDGLKAPVIVAGISYNGIDFDAPDDKLADIIFLMLTPKEDPGAQLEIAADIARLFRHPETLSHAHSAKNYTDFLALMKTEGVEA